MSNNFKTFMRAIDADLLEEAMVPQKKRIYRPWLGLVAAACLLIVLAVPVFRPGSTVAADAVLSEPEASPAQTPEITAVMLSEMGYQVLLPESAENVRYALVTMEDGEAVQASFTVGKTDYVYREAKTEQPRKLWDEAGESGQQLSWNVQMLDMQMMSSSSSTSVSWYDPDAGSQYCLSACADAREVLTTASRILQATGLDVAVAPEGAGEIGYHVFAMEDLTVAESTFVLDGISCSYRMAATTELMEDFTDISGLDGTFDRVAAGDISWCRAKISFDEGGRGKIIWFDVVPGILYSLSVDSGATEEMLLDLANSLFDPAQDSK